MSDAPEKDQKTEELTDKRRRDASEKGDVLQSRELGTALVVLAGATWLALAGPLFLGTLQDLLSDALPFAAAAVSGFDPGPAALRLVGFVLFPLVGSFTPPLPPAPPRP